MTDTQTDDQSQLDAIPCGYLSISSDGRITHANRRIAKWTGFAQKDLIGRRLHDILSVAGRIFYETNVGPQLTMQGSVDEIAFDFLTADGTKFRSLVNAAQERDPAGALLCTRLAIFNATERRRYERSLVDNNEAAERAAAAEREASRLREQFIAVLGHDMRNPLASISSGVRLLTDRETISARGQRVLNLMHGSVVRATDLIDNVMDFARGRLGGGISLSRDPAAPLTPVLEQVVAELASVSPGRDIRTSFDIVEPIDCDRMRIGQLLSNLLGNAVTHGAKTQPIVVDARTRDGQFVLSVTNGGEPISQAAMDRLFQPFFRGEVRANQMGLGLGLHIASEIAKAHGGDLTVSSNDEATRFSFTMPLPTMASAAT